MKKSRIVQYSFAALFIILLASYTLYEGGVSNGRKEEVLLRATIESLEQGHYQPKVIDDEFSARVYKLYLERIDAGKKFLIKSDVAELKKMELDIDNEIISSKFDFFNRCEELIIQRTEEAKQYYKDILAKPFDFNKEEEIELNSDKTHHSENKSNLKDEWRKSLKYQTMIRLAEKLQVQEKAIENKDTSIVQKSFDKLEEEARAGVLKSTEDLFNRLSRVDREDRFSLFIDCISNVYDPHTEYFASRDKENFDIAFSGRLEGIGATLQERDGYIRVQALVPGSPSFRQGELKVGDVILKVAQGKEEPVDVVNMRLDNAVKLVRGKKGTEVRLTVKKIDGAIKVIPIIRDLVIIEETYAQSAIINTDKKIGYIKLPGFYADFNGNSGRRASQDVAQEIAKLNKEGIQGIILDLRDNGGGSLQEAVEMGGLFIEKGPIVQVNTRFGSPYIYDDKDSKVQFAGPLVIMVNQNSASASEILAAAMQDYKRAIIVGSTSSFGKGTVQRIIELDDALSLGYQDVKPLGSLKLTIQKFYRINGKTTQLKGVNSDIVLPDIYDQLKTGEKEQDYPLSWDEIQALKFPLWTKDIKLEELKLKSKARIDTNRLFKLIADEAIEIKKQSENTVSSLQLKKFRAEQLKSTERVKRFDALEKEIPRLKISASQNDEVAAQADTNKMTRQKEFHKSIRKDSYINEAVSVLSDGF